MPKHKEENPITLSVPTLRLLFGFNGGAGILTGCPSTTPFGFALGPPNPWLIVIAKETLGFRCLGLSPRLRLLMPTFSLLFAPSQPYSGTSMPRGRSPINPVQSTRLHIFGIKLEPPEFSAQRLLASKLLRTF